MNEQKAAQLNREEKSRTEYSARNTTVAMIARVIAILLGFCTRVVFTHTLSEEYVGINGLFTDILNVLALSELGIGTAITYALYKPVAEKDIEKQKALMLLYKKLYRIVAAVVLAAGLLIVPFLDVLIKNRTQVEHITLLYLMYLANSVISYLMIYKKTLIDAHQLSYIGVVYQTIFLTVQNVAQIAILIATKNFILFLSILLLCTFLNNFCISRKANKLYPYLNDKKVVPLEMGEKKEIYQNIRAMLMHKVGIVVVNNTDNLLLSSLTGIVSVGIYSNYYLVIGSVRQVLNQMFLGITASVGNLGVEESKERVRNIFEASFFIGQWLFGFASICLFELLTPFVNLSFGSLYVFEPEITLVLCLNFYVTGMRQATLVFRDSLGLFWYDRYKSIVEAVINLMVSIVLGYYLGVVGIFIGTLCSTVTTSLWVEPFILYKYRLQTPVRGYFIKYGKYFLVTGIAWGITEALCQQVQGGLVAQLVFRLLICVFVVNILFLLIYGSSKEFMFVVNKMKKIFGKWLKKVDTSGEQKSGFSKEELLLFQMVKNSLEPEKRDEKHCNLSEEEWEKLVRLAERHGMVSLLYPELCENQKISDRLKQRVSMAAKQTVLQQYRLLFLSKYLISLLEENGIDAVILKGATVGTYYPVPELRKSGDVDLLLLNPKDLNKVKQLLEMENIQMAKEQSALHHVCFATMDGIEIEVHTMLAEPFDNEKTNVGLRFLFKEKKDVVVKKEIMGIDLPVLSTPYYAFELLLHMLQHFLRSGFGLRLLCDWVVFWKTTFTTQEKEQYMELVSQFGVRGFSDMITETCIKYLGLSGELMQWMDISSEYPVAEFMRETLDAEEFGKSNVNRMVVMRGTGIKDYFREFHHQMKLNYPKAGKCVLLWPLLWFLTLVRFIRNNRKLRKTSTRQVLREAKCRSRLMNAINIFK